MASDEKLPRKLTAILHADVVGYSRLMGEDEDGTHRLLRDYLDLISAAVIYHHGRVVSYAGDAVLADFATVTEALSCAWESQQTLGIRNQDLPDQRKVEFRIGVNLGEVIVDRDDIYGDGVNVAARLEALADPGGICVSESVRSAAGSKLPLGFEFMGEREVKNIAEPVRTYRVVDPDEADASRTVTCPYPGMVPFSAADAQHFYGRDEEVVRMVQLLRRQRFMMVIGPSGSGKSSLVYAGLLPELECSRFFAKGYWLIRTMRPGPKPTKVLAGVLGAEDDGAEFAPGSVDALLEAHAPAERLLLLVDQFEEVFTQAEREEQARFIAALQAFRAPENCALILTLRADFYPDLMMSYLWPVDASQRVEVAPLRGEALREAIERPAADVGVRIEDSLVNQLFADAADEPGALPLLQETMGLLWDDIEQRTLPYAAYQRLSAGAGRSDNGHLSGLAVAIAMKADTTLAELNASQQAIARRIFLRLIQFGEGRADTRRQQPVASLHAANDTAGEFERTLEQLTDNRLLTRSGGDERNPPSVDISHESLIGGWSRLQDWTDERREAEQIRRRLEDKAAEWVRLGKGSGGLLDEAELPEAERWLASEDAADLGYDASLPELVDASQRTIEAVEQAKEGARQRELDQAKALADERSHATGRMRRAMFGLAAVAVVAVAAGLLAWTQSQKAESRWVEAQAAAANAERLAAAEASARKESEARRVEAEYAQLSATAQSLSVQAPQQLAAQLDELGALMARQAYLFSANGSRRLKAGVDRVLRAAIGEPYFSPILRLEINAGIAVNHDGTRLASATIETGTVHLWDLTRPGEPPTPLPGGWPGDLLPGSGVPASNIFALAFSPDGAALLAASADGKIGRWDLENLEAPFVELPRQAGGVWSAAFSSDGRWLVLGSRYDDTFSLWDLEAPQARPALASDPQPGAARPALAVHQEGGVPVAFSSDGALLATGGLRGLVRIWNPHDLVEPVVTLRGHEGPLLALNFHPDGKHLASSGEDATIRLWNIEQPSAAPIVASGEFARASSLDFSPDGRTLLSAGKTGVQLWRTDTLQTPPVSIATGMVYRAILTPDGQQVVSGGNNTTYLRLWDLEPTGRPRVLAGNEGEVVSIAISPDMKLLASGEGNNRGDIRLWRWHELDAPPQVLRGHEGTVNSLQFSADGNRLLSASVNDNSVRLWDLIEPTPTSGTLPPPDETLEPWTAMFNPGTRTVLSAGVAGVYAWSFNDLQTMPRLLAPAPNWVSEIDVSPDGDTLAIAGLFPDVLLVSLSSPAEQAIRLSGHERDVWSVVFSPDGKTLASGGRNDGTVRLWDLTGPDAAAVVLGRHDDAVTRVRFSPDGKQLASVSIDNTVRLWDLDNYEAVPIVLDARSPVRSLAYSPDGKYLVAGSGDKMIRIWDLSHPLNASSTQEVADMACRKVRRNLTLDEWHTYIGTKLPYERTCPNLPVHPSLFETAERLAKGDDVASATALLKRAKVLDPKLDFDPEQEVQRLANSATE